MTTTFIISEAKVRAFTTLNNSVDTELIKNCIRTAQDYYLQSIIGTVLYEKILTDIDSGSLTGDYKTLVDSYIQDYLLYATYYETLEEIFIRPRNKGLLKPTGGENSVDVDLQTYNVKRQSVENKMTYYAERLTNYILEDNGLFPELDQNNLLYQQNPDYSVKYRSPFAMRGGAGARYANEYGFPAFDKRLQAFPQNYYGYGKKNNLPK